jgi:hypothetical protein
MQSVRNSVHRIVIFSLFSSACALKVYHLVWVTLAFGSDLTNSDDTPVVKTCNFKH